MRNCRFGHWRVWAAVAAVSAWCLAGAGSSARAYTVEDTNLFEFVSAEAQWYLVADTSPNYPLESATLGVNGFQVHFRVKCNLEDWDSVPTGVELMGPDGGLDGMTYEDLKDTDYILFRLAVDQGSYPSGDARIVPTYLRAQTLTFDYDFWLGTGLIFTDTNCLVDEYYPGDYIKLPVGKLREQNGYFEFWWQSQRLYPTTASWLCQCLLEKRGVKFYLDGALVSELVSSDVPTVIKTASAVDVFRAGRTATPELDLMPNPEDVPGDGDETWDLYARGGGSVRGDYGVSAERKDNGRVEITYTTIGNQVDYYWTKEFDHEGTGLGPKDGRWLVTFVHVDPDGGRHPIPTAELSFEEDSPRMEFPIRRYPDVEVTQTDSGYKIVTTQYEVGMGFESVDGYSYELPTNPATYKLVWSNPYAEGYIEAWVSYKNLHTAYNEQVLSNMGLSDWFFGDRVIGGTTWTPATTSYTLTQEEFDEALEGIGRHHRKIVHSPLPFGEYREGRSEEFGADRRTLDLWKAFHGTEPILESDGLSYLRGYAAAFPGGQTPWNWRVDGVTKFTTYGGDEKTGAWEPRVRGMHVADVEYGEHGVAAKVAVWYDEPRWAPLPSAGPNAVPGPKAVSLYPWTNAVAIEFALDAMDPSREAYVNMEYKTKTDGQFDQDEWQENMSVTWSLSDVGPETYGDSYWLVQAEETPETLYWDLGDDLGSGVSKKEAELRLTTGWEGVRYPSKWHPLQYLIVDVSGGPNAESWPMTVREFEPKGGWGDEYKTDKIVLRRVKHGDFTMGSPTNEPGRSNREGLHTVRLTETYYIGVFEITQAQWENVMGEKPPCWSAAYSDGRLPVRSVSYDDVRGEKLGQGWPENMKVDTDSFFGRLREKANGLAWDLPTEAQWEMACRAGTDTAWNDGSDIHVTTDGTRVDEALSRLGRYKANQNDGAGGGEFGGPALVGSYQGNGWGIYDMHGNVAELTRDRQTVAFGSERADDGAYVDPKGNPDTGIQKIMGRGGSYQDDPWQCRSAWRLGTETWDHTERKENTGFRAGAFVWPFGLDWN